jgi:UDP-glucose 4-epimerase
MNNKPEILVTGGTGYIGSHATTALLQEGYRVILADNLSNSDASIPDRITEISGKKPAFEKIDLTSRDEVNRLFKKYPGVEGIIHFAAFKSVGESVKKPLKYYHNNINCLLNLLAEMPKGIKSFIFSSSCTVYGVPEKLPVSESSPIQRPYSPYGNTKKICEEILQEYLNADGIAPVISLRYFNPIGAHESGKIGELPTGIPDNLIPYVTQTAAGIRDKVTIYGNDFPTNDGTCIRDYIDVNDLVEAHILALERNLKGQHNEQFEVFNLGTGKGFSVKEIVDTFEKVNHVQVNHTYGPRRPGDVAEIWADPSKANTVLGWKAHRNLEDMLKTAWKWECHIRQLQHKI